MYSSDGLENLASSWDLTFCIVTRICHCSSKASKTLAFSFRVEFSDIL